MSEAFFFSFPSSSYRQAMVISASLEILEGKKEDVKKKKKEKGTGAGRNQFVNCTLASGFVSQAAEV